MKASNSYRRTLSTQVKEFNLKKATYNMVPTVHFGNGDMETIKAHKVIKLPRPGK